MSWDLNCKILLQRGRYNPDIGSCAGMFGTSLKKPSFSRTTALLLPVLTSKSARSQARVFFCKTHTWCKKTKLSKELQPAHSHPALLIYTMISNSSQVTRFTCSQFPYATSSSLLQHNSSRLLPFRSSFWVLPRVHVAVDLGCDGIHTALGNEQYGLASVGCLSREAKGIFHPFVPTGPSPLPLVSTGSGSTRQKASSLCYCRITKSQFSAWKQRRKCTANCPILQGQGLEIMKHTLWILPKISKGE